MESSRFPGKPLAPIKGIPMIIYCARNAIETGFPTYVCTDSKEIESICNLYDVNVIRTEKCNTGTDRVAQAVANIDSNKIINLQGDEPLIKVKSLNLMIEMLNRMDNKSSSIINGVIPISSEDAFDPNNVKCALTLNKAKIQYFSRKALLNSIEGSNKPSYYKQLGLYGMTRETLLEFSSLKQGQLEKAEKVELLRWIEYGNEIMSCLIDIHSISVDIPEDLVNLLSYLDEIE